VWLLPAAAGAPEAACCDASPGGVAWPAALLPRARLCAAAGDSLALHADGAAPVVLNVSTLLPPRLGNLLELSPAAANSARPTSLALVSAGDAHEGPCLVRGWARLSAGLAAALRLPAQPDSSRAACACPRWLLAADAAGVVRAHAILPHAAAGDCGPAPLLSAAQPLCSLGEPAIALLPSAERLYLVGGAGRIVALRADGDGIASDELAAPRGRVRAALLLPLLDGGGALALATPGGAALLRLPAAPGAARWARASRCDAAGLALGPGGALLLLARDGAVRALPPPALARLLPIGADAAPPAGAGVARALCALRRCEAARTKLGLRHAPLDAELAGLSALLPAAAALTADAGAGAPPLLSASLAARESAQGPRFELRLRNRGSRELAAVSWRLLLRYSCAGRSGFASTPLPVPLRAGGGALVLALPRPAWAEPRRARVRVSAWLAHAPGEAAAPMRFFRLLDSSLDVLAAAQPAGEARGAEPQALRLALQLPLGRGAEGAIEWACGADGLGTAVELPSGASLRSAGAGAGAAVQFTLSSPAPALHAVPLVRAPLTRACLARGCCSAGSLRLCAHSQPRRLVRRCCGERLRTACPSAPLRLTLSEDGRCWRDWCSATTSWMPRRGCAPWRRMGKAEAE